MLQNELSTYLLSEHVFASLPQMERGVAKVIGGDPKGKNFLYTNGKCVIIRNIEVIFTFIVTFHNDVLLKCFKCLFFYSMGLIFIVSAIIKMYQDNILLTNYSVLL